MNNILSNDTALLSEIRILIDTARQRVAKAFNAELSLLYWQIGQRLQSEVLVGERAKYGTQLLQKLGEQLAALYGRGWSKKQLWHCLRFAETFPQEEIVSALRRLLSWTHIKTLIYIDDPLKRDFYLELCKIEGWSSRQLQERINSMLYERSALSKQPESLIKQELASIRQNQEISPAIFLKDPYFLDFLGLNDRIPLIIPRLLLVAEEFRLC